MSGFFEKKRKAPPSVDNNALHRCLSKMRADLVSNTAMLMVCSTVVYLLLVLSILKFLYILKCWEPI